MVPAVAVAQKRVAVFLKDGNAIVVGEKMDEEAAQAEFERILAEKPTEGDQGRLIRVGKTAAFTARDFSRIEIQDPPTYIA